MMAGPTVASDGAVYMPVKDGRLGMIDIRDIADSAVAVLTGDGHDGAIYTLTGPASISFNDVASGLSKALGKEVNYVDVPPEASREALAGMGIDDWTVEALHQYFKIFSENWGDFTTDEVEKLTGHPARSYEQFAADFAGVFGAESVLV